MSWKKLTDTDGSIMWINLNTISHMYRDGDVTFLYEVGPISVEFGYSCKETPEEILG